MTQSKDSLPLTTAVGVGRLHRPVLQTVQDLSLSNIAVSHQQKFQEIIVTLDRAALGPHHPTHWIPVHGELRKLARCLGERGEPDVPDSGDVSQRQAANQLAAALPTIYINTSPQADA